MAYLTVKKDISFWPVSEEWSVIFSRSKGKSICIPTEWKDTLLSKVCDLKNDFDDQTLQLFIDYGLPMITSIKIRRMTLFKTEN